MSHPARCNKRACQARRTLSMRVVEYVVRPGCHIAGCSGLMYTVKRGVQDMSPGETVCQMDCRPWPHKTSDKQCRHYLEYMKTRAATGHLKHSPVTATEWTPF